VLAFLQEYGLFLAQLATFLLVLLGLIVVVASFSQRQRLGDDGYIEVRNLNERYRSLQDAIYRTVMEPDEYKLSNKAKDREEKQQSKLRRREAKKAAKSVEQGSAVQPRPRLYVLDFDGDIKASAVDNLREEISTVLPLVRSGDEVLVRLESPGGQVHSYGLAASQLQRIVDAEVPLTVAVDAVAASGGYLMACVAQRIVAAPFAMLGSIGVLAQLPNFHRLLKKNDIDYELLTAGEYKRTLTMFGENTEQGRAKFQEDIDSIHEQFKQFVLKRRPVLDMSRIATGEVWFGEEAVALGLVDALGTSDALIQERLPDWDVLQVSWRRKRNWQEKLGMAAETAFERSALKIWRRGQTHPLL
jgi:serine protease SohB